LRASLSGKPFGPLSGTRRSSTRLAFRRRGYGPQLLRPPARTDSGGFRGYIGGNPMARKEKGPVMRGCKLSLRDAFPSSDQDRCQAVISAVRASLRHVSPKGFGALRVGDPKFDSRGEKSLVNAD
jgi:hypothetical protein